MAERKESFTLIPLSDVLSSNEVPQDYTFIKYCDSRHDYCFPKKLSGETDLHCPNYVNDGKPIQRRGRFCMQIECEHQNTNIV